MPFQVLEEPAQEGLARSIEATLPPRCDAAGVVVLAVSVPTASGDVDGRRAADLGCENLVLVEVAERLLEASHLLHDVAPEEHSGRRKRDVLNEESDERRWLIDSLC